MRKAQNSMAEVQLIHRPALAASFASNSGAISLDILPEGRVIQILGSADHGDLAALLADLAGSDMVRTAGPGQWFIVGDTPIGFAELQAMGAKLAPKAFAVDQSHGRVRIAVSGSAVRSVLAKGTAIDLDMLAPSQSATTLVGHISVHVTRTATDRFELMVLRGFAGSLWDDLVRMSAEYA
jgi:sarcosine oxidase subunit gamma